MVATFFGRRTSKASSTTVEAAIPSGTTCLFPSRYNGYSCKTIPCRVADRPADGVDVRIIAWLKGHKGGPGYAFPLLTIDDPNGQGIGWHGMGGQAWGRHLACPGDSAKDQRTTLIADALSLIGGPSKSPPSWPGRYLRQPPIMQGNDVQVWQEEMHNRGWQRRCEGCAWGWRCSTTVGRPLSCSSEGQFRSCPPRSPSILSAEGPTLPPQSF
jgi:hypothetical protein